MMDKVYQHQNYEKKIYEAWEKSGALTPPPTSEVRIRGMEPYCIIMPPPNANDPLHVGHAMFVTVEDILIRYQRMLGKAALWLPGTDHAGIETQYVFEKKLKKEGKSRFNFDRETLYQMIWDYVQQNSNLAIEQMKQLGASADWSRQKFTLDPEIVDQVLKTFEKMHDEGLVYRDLRLVNYCTKCGTGYSELEVKYEERNDPLYYMKYGPFTLATVRPETKFGDTAVAVNPKDKRYKQYIGQEIEVEGLLGLFKIKVIADEYVDRKFGTGVVKITPAHDPNDFAVWQKHREEIPGPKQVIGFDGKLNELTGKYAGMRVEEARKQVVADLRERGLLVRVNEKYVHNIGTCYRCGAVIEPLPMAQFFIKVAPLTKKALEMLDKGETKIFGKGHDKILKHWLTNLKDWNISRQIVWGIRLPIWYRISDRRQATGDKNGEVVVGFLDEEGKYVRGEIGELLERYPFELIEKNLQTLTAPREAKYTVSRTKPSFAKTMEGKDGQMWLQETDTFDTWFSSSQWPVVTLHQQGQNDKVQISNDKQMSKSKSQQSIIHHTSEDMDYYYPTAVMETGYDILPIWVMRMMLMGIYLTGKTPFKKVYLHGLVRDEKGQKMSKSKGNVMDPLELVGKYGADALRMALVMSTTAGQDSAVGENKVRGMRNFSNKIWNASRFVMMNLENSKSKIQSPKQTHNSNDYALDERVDPSTALNLADLRSVQDDKRDLNSLSRLSSENDEEFGKRLNKMVKQVTGELDRLKIGQAAETVHNEFWHWFCDEAIEMGKQGLLSPTRLEEGLRTFLILIHPFMPFVTEAVWQEMGWDKEKGLLIGQKWEGKQKSGARS